MPGLEKNRIYRAHIDGYSSEGLGIARIDGQVVFVHGAIRGEVCDVLVMKVLKNAAFGKIAALVEPSPARRVPDCPYYGRCGGCDFRHMSYEEELWAKRARVQDALTRIGGAEVTVEEILGADQPLHYRNKSIYPISPAGEVGFYRARSHQVVHVEHCLIQKPEADALAQALRDYIARFRVAPYNEATGRGLLRHLYVRTSCRGESLVCLLVNGSRLPHEEELVAMLRAAVPKTCGVVLGENTRRGNAILGDRYRTLWGRDYLTDTLCGLELRLSVPSFYQVNHDQAQRLYEKALEYAGLTGRELAVDLYCGPPGPARHRRRDRPGGHPGRGGQRPPQRRGQRGVPVRRRLPAGGGTAAAGPAARRDLRGPAQEGAGPRRGGGNGLHGAGAHRLCLLRPGHPGPGCGPLRPPGLPLRPGLRRGPVPRHGERGDGVSIDQASGLRQKYGITERENYNKPKSENAKQPQCPPEKEKAITEALRHFGMI